MGTNSDIVQDFIDTHVKNSDNKSDNKFIFGKGSQDSQSYGKYQENAHHNKFISIPCRMCSKENAKIFPIIKPVKVIFYTQTMFCRVILQPKNST